METTSDGVIIILRRAAVYPIELYAEERIQEFERLNTVPPELEARVETFLRKKKNRRKRLNFSLAARPARA